MFIPDPSFFHPGSPDIFPIPDPVSRSVADPDPGSGAFLTPGSEIRDPGSQTHIFERLVTTFWVKSIIL
jgi:hypothetical protein